MRYIPDLSVLYLSVAGVDIVPDQRRIRNLCNCHLRDYPNHPLHDFRAAYIPRQIVEAALTSGCTKRQMLWKVRMPIAFPEMLLGLNQTLISALFTAMIAGFIGTADLSQEIFRALSFYDGGKGLVIGFCVSLIGLTADRLLVEWSLLQKRRLVFAS